MENCVGKALHFGDIRNPDVKLRAALENENIKVLNSEYDTQPNVFYLYSGFDPSETLVPRKPAVKSNTLSLTETVTDAVNPIPAENPKKIIYTADVMCPAECPIAVSVEDGKAVRIAGNRHSLMNQGTLCGKGASGLEMTYSRQRIKTPLLRQGKRGEDSWKAVTWEEASDYLAKELVRLKKQYGAESVVVDCGDVTDQEAYHKLFFAFGTPNVFNHGSVCDTNRKWGQKIMLGDERPLPDLQRPILVRDEKGQLQRRTKHDAKLVMHLGVNSLVATRFSFMARGITNAKNENGCIFIVTDPSYTNSAAKADIWLPVKPGSDPALLAAMLLYIITNDDPAYESTRFIDHSFVERYTIGWDEFRDEFLSYANQLDPANQEKYFSLAWAEERTGIKREKIEEVARLFGVTKPASMEIGMHGTAHHSNGDVTSVLMSALCLVTGNMDVPGGLVFVDSQKVKKGRSAIARENLDRLIVRKIDSDLVSGTIGQLKKDTFGEYPASWKGVLADLPQDIRNQVGLKYGAFKGFRYPIKAFINRTGNPVMTAGHTGQWIDAFTKTEADGRYALELIVHIDTHLNETGKYADLILPQAGYLERMGLSDVYSVSPEVALRDKVIEPLYDSKTDFEIMVLLADKLAEKNDTDINPVEFGGRYKNEEEFINHLLIDSPGIYNIGLPLPYPELPEGCIITGIPGDPIATQDGKVVKRGTALTAGWLRKNKGIATWPTSYYRFKNSSDHPSGVFPATHSKKFEFRFDYLAAFNERYQTNFPTSFYWYESRWDPKNKDYEQYVSEYPFQLISGRAHHTGTMTQVCGSLNETETECMKRLNGMVSNEKGLENCDANNPSMPVFSLSSADGESLGIQTGDNIILETPLGTTASGKAYLTEALLPGVIKTVFGSGGRLVDGLSILGNKDDNTPNINALIDPENLNKFTGMPGFGDVMVKIRRLSG
ncbi:MAG: molybdopterin-dependent oxidoreductase [Proteobacteria bacterium]|nr:molybdopterin-dependent oxidoreductase [Pseudomonadota bacterium]